MYLLTFCEHFSIYIAFIDEMLVGKHLFFCQTLMKILHNIPIWICRRSRCYFKEKIWSIRITCFSKMNFLSDPSCIFLLAIPCLNIIRRLNKQC